MHFNSPLHTAKADRIIAQFRLKSGSRVLDVGCGAGEFLVRVAERYEIEGLGVDLNAADIAAAQTKADQRIKSGKLTFAAQNALAVLDHDAAYDLIICIGSEYIFGGYESALKKLKPLLTAGGLLLIGTIYWKQVPPPDYLQLMGGENPHFDHATTVQLAAADDFIPLYICRSNADEWDDFESAVSQRQYLEALSQAPATEIAKQIDSIRAWQNGYLKWGITTMGFGFYLLRHVP